MFGLEKAAENLPGMVWLLCRFLFALYLYVLSIMDIRWKRLNVPLLLSGFLPAAAGAVCSGDGFPVLSLAGGAVGAAFLLISRATGESFGYGDSILILEMGIFLGFWDILSVLMAAFFLAAGFSVFMLIRRRFHRKSAFAFVPFLAAAYTGGMLFGYC